MPNSAVTEPRDAVARSKRILGLVDAYHENPTEHARTALRGALMDEFELEPRASAGVIAAARAVIEADRAQTLTTEHVNALDNAIKIQRGQLTLPETRAEVAGFTTTVGRMLATAPHFEECDTSEPCLSALIHRYYENYFDREKGGEHAELYIEALYEAARAGGA